LQVFRKIKVTVFELISHLKSYARSYPLNGNARVLLRNIEGDICFPHFTGGGGKTGPGQTFFLISPLPHEQFSMIEAEKLN
jgi:hypothetical protein